MRTPETEGFSDCHGIDERFHNILNTEPVTNPFRISLESKSQPSRNCKPLDLCQDIHLSGVAPRCTFRKFFAVFDNLAQRQEQYQSARLFGAREILALRNPEIDLNQTTRDWHTTAVTLNEVKGLILPEILRLRLRMTQLKNHIVKCTNVMWFDLAPPTPSTQHLAPMPRLNVLPLNH